MGKASLLKTQNGHILLVINKTRDNEETIRRFFYDKKINISLPLVIDNNTILTQLGRTSSKPITIGGEYEVFETAESKFIIIE